MNVLNENHLLCCSLRSSLYPNRHWLVNCRRSLDDAWNTAGVWIPSEWWKTWCTDERLHVWEIWLGISHPPNVLISKTFKMNMACFQTSIANSQMENFFFKFLWSHNQSEAIVHLTEHKAIHLLLRFNLNTVAILCANIFSFSNISLRKLYRTCFICMIRALRKVFFRLNFAIVALLFSRLTFILSRWSCFMQKQSHPWGW